MAANWNVEEALDEVMARIRQGSALAFRPGDSDQLRARYRGPFQAQHDAGADWNLARPRILPMAQLVGFLATTLTSAAALLTGDRPVAVDRQSALLAAYLVSQLCHYPAAAPAVVPFGVYCAGFSPAGISGSLEDHAQLIAPLWAVLDHLQVLPPPRRSPAPVHDTAAPPSERR
jgi:hypothetical protein